MQQQPNPPLPFPENWQTALAVAAHPDDLEYGAAAAIAKWTAQGKQITYLMVSKGEAGIDAIPPSQTGPLRAQEEINAAQVVGVNTVEFLAHPDGIIEYGLPLRRDLSRAIRQHRPEIILTLSHRLQFPSGHLNMADHRHTALAVFDAARDAANRWIFPELLNENLQPWNGVRFVALFGPANPTHGIDVTGYWQKGLDSLRQHQVYLDNLGPAAANTFDQLTAHAAQSGQTLNCQHALLTELVLINEPWQ